MKKLTLLTLGASAGLMMTPAFSMSMVWSGGHGDIALEDLGGGQLGLGLHLGEGTGRVVDGVFTAGDEEFEASDIAISVITQAQVNDTELANGLGIAAGDSAWFLPDVSGGLNTVLLGIGAEELSPQWTDITISLVSVTGPGNFATYLASAGGGFDFAFSDALGGIDASDVVNANAGSHNEYNFAFSEAGTYQVELRAQGTFDGGVPSIVTEVFTFAVPEPSTTLLGLIGVCGLLRRRR